MSELPKHIVDQMRELIREGKSADEIAFMMRVSRVVVEFEIERVNTTEKRVATTR